MNTKNFFLISLAVALGIGSIEIFKAYIRSQEHTQYCYKIADKILAIEAIPMGETTSSSFMNDFISRSNASKELYGKLEEECKAQETEIVRYLKEHKQKQK